MNITPSVSLPQTALADGKIQESKCTFTKVLVVALKVLAGLVCAALIAGGTLAFIGTFPILAPALAIVAIAVGGVGLATITAVELYLKFRKPVKPIVTPVVKKPITVTAVTATTTATPVITVPPVKPPPVTTAKPVTVIKPTTPTTPPPVTSTSTPKVEAKQPPVTPEPPPMIVPIIITPPPTTTPNEEKGKVVTPPPVVPPVTVSTPIPPTPPTTPEPTVTPPAPTFTAQPVPTVTPPAATVTALPEPTATPPAPTTTAQPEPTVTPEPTAPAQPTATAAPQLVSTVTTVATTTNAVADATLKKEPSVAVAQSSAKSSMARLLNKKKKKDNVDDNQAQQAMKLMSGCKECSEEIGQMIRFARVPDLDKAVNKADGLLADIEAKRATSKVPGSKQEKELKDILKKGKILLGIFQKIPELQEEIKKFIIAKDLTSARDTSRNYAICLGTLDNYIEQETFDSTLYDDLKGVVTHSAKLGLQVKILGQIEDDMSGLDDMQYGEATAKMEEASKNLTLVDDPIFDTIKARLVKGVKSSQEYIKKVTENASTPTAESPAAGTPSTVKPPSVPRAPTLKAPLSIPSEETAAASTAAAASPEHVPMHSAITAVNLKHVTEEDKKKMEAEKKQHADNNKNGINIILERGLKLNNSDDDGHVSDNWDT